MTNLNLMVGDWVNVDGENEQVIDIAFIKGQMCAYWIGIGARYSGRVPMYKVKPIPLSPELMERIEGWVKCKDNSTYGSSYTNEVFRIRFLKDKFWRILYKDVTFDNIEGHLHQLQQLIRLFTNKEIEVKWEK